MIADEDARPHRIAFHAARELRADRIVSARVRGRAQCGREGIVVLVRVWVRATVHSGEICQLRHAMSRIRARSVVYAVRHEIGGGRVVRSTTAHRSTRMNRNAAKDVTHGASERVGHGASHVEALGEDARGVDAELALEILEQRLDERDVGSTGPSVVRPPRRHEDRAFSRQIQQTVVGAADRPGVPVGDLHGGSAQAVKRKDQPVGGVRVVVVGESKVGR